MAGIGWLEHQHSVRLVIGAKTGEVCEGRMRTEPVIGVVRAHLEPAGRNDQPLAGKLSTDPFPTLASRPGSSKLIWQFFRVRRPPPNDELLEGI